MIYKKALICKTKNLFSTSTEVGKLSGFSNTTPRQFEEGKWYIGISGNNYYAPNNIVEYELTENYVYVNTKGSGYGIGKAFKCEPNQTYTVSCKLIKNTTNNMNIATGFFDENGNYLSYIGAGYLGKRLTFTTPVNCKWFTVCFTCTVGSSYIYNIQLEKGSTPTSYVPYGYLQSYKRAIKVSDVFVYSYKSTVICKTKNLFDISKVTNSTSIQSDDKDIICSTYGASIGVLKNLCPSLKAGDVVTLSLKVKSTTSVAPNFVQIQGQILNFKVNTPTFTVTEAGLNSNFYLYNTTYENRNVPTTSVYTDIMIELGDTATPYVPYWHL